MSRALVRLVALVVALPLSAAAYTADLLPVSNRPDAADITGTIAIGGADGTIHVVIENVNDAAGDSLDGAVTLQLKLRVNGVRRRISLPMAVDTGDGELTFVLGLSPGDSLVVQDVRVRGRSHILAQAGVVLVAATPSPPPTLPPPPDQCPAALAACQSDLDDCNVELDDCEFGN